MGIGVPAARPVAGPLRGLDRFLSPPDGGNVFPQTPQHNWSMASYPGDLTATENRDLLDQVAAIVEHTPIAVQGYDEQARITFWNRASTELYGFSREAALGKRLDELIFTPEEEREFEAMLAAILATGSAAPPKEWSINTAAGRRRHILSSLFPIRLGDGQTRVICMDLDITERKEGEESLRRSEERSRDLADRLGALLRELDHRVKNNLASLHALVDLYARSAPSVSAFAQAMRGKLLAMRAAHDLTAAQAGRSVPLTELLHNLIRQHEPPGRGGSTVALDGQPLRIAPRQVGPLIMVFQELFANSAKHGALRDLDGKIAVAWRLLGNTDSGRQVKVTWSERAVRPIGRPGKPGVGLGLIESFARFELSGQATFSFDRAGLQCTIDCVLDVEEPAGSSGA